MPYTGKNNCRRTGILIVANQLIPGSPGWMDNKGEKGKDGSRIKVRDDRSQVRDERLRLPRCLARSQ